MKGPLALLLYCLLFSTLFLLFYTFLSQDRDYDVARRSEVGVGRSGRPYLSKYGNSESQDQSWDSSILAK